MISPERLEKFRAVASQRMMHVSVAVETLHHRHNVSAILRTCDALGVHRVYMIGGGRFVPSKNTARGAHRWLDIRRHDDVQDGIAAIKADGYDIWVADLDDPPVAPRHVPTERPLCLWFGGELRGVHAMARANATGVVTIPMVGFAQSLNVSVAAALTVNTVAGRVRDQFGAAANLPEATSAELLAGWIARDEARKLRTQPPEGVNRITLDRPLPPFDEPAP